MNDTIIKKTDFHIPTREEFRKGYEAYSEKEKRGSVYFEALDIVVRNWGEVELMAKGVQRLIRSWNRFYGNFNVSDLASFLDNTFYCWDEYKNKHIFDLSGDDDESIRKLFNGLLHALKRQTDGALSAVSVAKAFGVLTPNFLPIWDSSIAFQYGCFYLSEIADNPYLNFCHKMQVLAEEVQHYVPQRDDRALLKRIDEYNYSKYTMHWI